MSAFGVLGFPGEAKAERRAHEREMDKAAGLAPWYLDAAELLGRPDPGPTPWLVEDMVIEAALIAVVGRWKTTKSYGVLDLCIAIATGRAAFGTFAIPNPGPVVFVNEESGEAALWRRLDALCRGRAIDPEELRGRLFVSPNRRIKLDDPGWQAELVATGKEIEPRMFVFDPLARMKAAGRNESEQKDMSPVIDFWRELREETRAAVALVHHTGHQGENIRGTSDMETAWETRLHWSKAGSEVTIKSEHREAEGTAPFSYRIAWDGLTRSMRFEAVEDENAARVREYLDENPDASGNAVFKALGGSRPKVLELVKTMREQVVPEAEYHPGTIPLRSEAEGGTTVGVFRRPGTTSHDPPLEVVPNSEYHPPEPRPVVGHDDYPAAMLAALHRRLITADELVVAFRAHKLVRRTPAPPPVVDCLICGEEYEPDGFDQLRCAACSGAVA